MHLQSVQCPNCECIKSWKKLYSEKPESAEWAVEREHSTRCNECQTVFTYTPKLKRRWFWFGRKYVVARNIKQVENA